MSARAGISHTGEHLHYVDLVRVLTVGLVIGLHVLALAPVPPTVGLGALIIVFHVSREVFFLLTAFVLTYGTSRRKPHWPSFWRKRYLFVVVPYLTWTLLYFFADGPPFKVDVLGQQLLTGTARYHLYFLLVSMQIYLVFPLIRALLRATVRYHGWLLAGGAAFQLLFSLAVQQDWPAGVLTGWLHFPDALLPSYLGYVLAGAIAGWHREELIAWTRAHARVVFAGCAGAIALGVGGYLAQVFLAGQTPLAASMVWQPAVAVESVAIAWAFLALGLRWQDRGRPAHRPIVSTSDASFGIYLIHPLVLQGALLGAGATGLVDAAQAAPTALVLLFLVAVALPAIYLVSGLVTAVVRRTPASLALSGRARRRAVPVHTKPSPARRTVNA
ncbi:acyltransferase [Amycolatopsis taiwanensis]|uniref:Acyltransferase n=1 Tax=Amycolatopsis taiwanensis TaxID=342230 RepID=A0A9W6QZE0_9PSEU|nr:acyltransferase [Amycolatopsis taiwanensis]GLY65640.1 acyltransferase [Amycolatopsis taiwanensis]